MIEPPGGPSTALAMPNLYENWNRRVTFVPHEVVVPPDELALAAVVQRARARGQAVKAVGSGHSFNEIMQTPGVLVDMHAFDRLIEVEPRTCEARVQAGMKLRDLVVALETRGLALPNIGAWMEQTIGGVMATGTHGTGGRWKHNLTDALLGYRLIDGRGRIVDVEGEALRYLPLGYFGIVTELRLRCVPLFHVRQAKRVALLHETIDGLEDALAQHDFVDLRFAGRLPYGSLSTWDATAERPSALDHARWHHEGARQFAINRAVSGFCALHPPEEVSNRVFETVGRVYLSPGRSAPKNLVWWRGLTFNSKEFAPAHDEYEFALPRACTRAFLHEVAESMQAARSSASIEIQVRFGEAVDIVLAPNRDRCTTWFNVNVFDARTGEPMVERLTAMARDHGGRPHWAKCIPASFQGEPIDGITAWEAQRRAFDPDGLFLNAWYRTHLEPTLRRDAVQHPEWLQPPPPALAAGSAL